MKKVSLKKRTSVLAITSMMLMTTFVPVSIYADTEETESTLEAEAATEETVVVEDSQDSEDSTDASTPTETVTVTSVKLNHSALSLKVGKSIQLKAVVKPEGEVAWSSSNPKVAQVDVKGNVVAKSAGKAEITASCEGKSDTCVVEVSLTAPTGVKIKSLGIHTMQIQWEKVAGADGYSVYRSEKEDGTYKKIGKTQSTSYKDKKADTGVEYFYKVCAYAGKSEGDFSKVVSEKARPPKTTVKLKAGEGQIKVSWKAVSSAHGYHVYRADTKGGKYKRIKGIGDNKIISCTDYGLKGGKVYRYKVRSYRIVDGKKTFSHSSKVVKAKAKKTNLKAHKSGFLYKDKFVVKAYAYTGGGRTAMGTPARKGAIAVDPKVIPLSTNVYVEGYGHARAEDTGGNIKGKTVDLYMDSISACMKWGVRYKTVYVDVKK